MKSTLLVESRWLEKMGLPLIDLGCAVLAGVWWILVPHAGGWPLVVVFVPLVIRLAAGISPVRRTTLDIPILIFWVTAGVGIWAAYNRVAAWDKFWLITAGCVLYFALAGQPRSNWRLVCFLGGVVGAGLSSYFLLIQDWIISPADIGIINRLAIVWVYIRPAVQGPWLHPDIAGGILAMLLPFNLALVMEAVKSGFHGHSKVLILAAGLLAAITAIGLLMTSSRSAWLVLVAGLGILVWWLVSGWLTQKWAEARSKSARSSPTVILGRIGIFFLPFLVVGLLGLSLMGLRMNSVVQIATRLPGAADMASRIETACNTLQLIRDYPFTGGGLGSFSGLYSTYIRVIQVPEFYYSHNMYLDMALEQGLFGLFAFGLTLLGTGWILFQSLAAGNPETRATANLINPYGKESSYFLAAASLVSLMVLILNGFVDDSLYGIGGTPLLFVVSGVIASLQTPFFIEGHRLTNSGPKLWGIVFTRAWVRSMKWYLIAASLSLLFILVVVGKSVVSRLASTWYANLGAVEMSRLQLSGWPEATVSHVTIQDQLVANDALFKKAIGIYEGNPTAWYRLGVSAYSRRDFENAVSYLNTAYVLNPNHLGIRKYLGYTYTWTGDLDEAKPILATISEAGYEMSIFAWWWGTQKRADLAALASQMAVRLNYP